MPISPFSERPWNRPGPTRVSRRQVVAIPDDSSNTAVLFILLRRLRLPLLLLVGILTVATFGMSLIDGVDAQGNPHRLTIFESFYFMTYTAATVGYTELYPYTSAQRMWVTGSIFAAVLGWAYALGTFLSIIGDQAFKDAVGLQRFRRAVHRINEPFHIVAGFGNAGRLVSQGLDNLGHRFVVIDSQRSRIDVLRGDQLESDPPGWHGDLHSPSLLGWAGLGHEQCRGVIALTDDDEINLSVVMAAHLLRPDVSVIARCGAQSTEEIMSDFGPDAVINPYDRYGGYLVLALERPITHQLITWLLAANGSQMPPRRAGLAAGRWVVVGDGEFEHELVEDLGRVGLDVVVVDPADGPPDVSDAVGFVAGSPIDTANISMASRARLSNPDLYVAVRQYAHGNMPLVQALDFDSVFSPTVLVAQEVLARLTTPHLWRFMMRMSEADEAWSEALLGTLEASCGSRSPRIRIVEVDEVHAPAVVRWLRRGNELTVGALVSGSGGANTPTEAVALMLARKGVDTLTPDAGTPLQEGDILLIAGRSAAFGDVDELLHQDSTVAFAATGEYPDDTWVWRQVRRRRAKRSVDR